jgi:branched-chain amino acid transport system substrate-binding protein
MMKMKTRSRLTPRLGAAALTALAALAALATGCSSSKSSSPADISANLKGSTIKIGQLISLTGPTASSDAGGAKVAEAWADWVNSTTGINGHPVQVVAKDDRGDGATSVANAKDLVADSSVLALTSSESATETTVSSYLKGQNIAVVGAVGYSPAVWGAVPNYFTTASSGFPADVLVQFMSAKGVGSSKWSAVYCSEAAACKGAVQLYGPGAAQQNISYLGSVAVSTTQPSYTAECLKLIRQGTDFIQLGLAPAAGKRLISDCQAQGFKGYFGATAGAVEDTLSKISGVKLAGGLNGFPWYADAPAAKQYRDAMSKYEPGATIATPSNTVVWASLQLIRKALSNVGASATRDDVFTGLYSLNNETLAGLLPQPMTYTKGKPAPQVNCIWMYKEDNGTFSTVTAGPSGNNATGDLQSTCVTPLGA